MKDLWALEGRDVCDVRFHRWPIRWSGDGRYEDAVYFDDRVPFAHLRALYLELDEGEWMRIDTVQDNDLFGIDLSSSQSPDRVVTDPKDRRPEPAPQFPRGRVHCLATHADHNAPISEFLFLVNGKPILLVAAEIDEDWGDKLVFRREDESVFVLTALEQLAGWRFADVDAPFLAGEFATALAS